MIQPDPNWTVYAAPINAVLQAAQQMGVDREQLLAAAGIDGALLRQPYNCIPAHRYYLLYQLAEQATDNPDIALTVGRISYYSGLNLQLHMATVCRSFRDYLNLMPSVLKLRGDIGEVLIRREAEMIRLEWLPLWPESAAQRYLSDDMLAASAAIVDSLCVFPVPVRRAHFSYAAPANTAELRAVFGSELLFGQDVSCLYFDRAALDYPLIQQDYEVQSSLLDPFVDLVEERQHGDTFLVALRGSVAQLLHEGDLGIDAVATQLNVSRRTLQRRLADRGTNFKQELQQVRVQMARRYLRDRRLAITEIAFLLGYNDQGSFSNAFRNWYGISPTQYRSKE